jgi:hypothetical protein
VKLRFFERHAEALAILDAFLAEMQQEEQALQGN